MKGVLPDRFTKVEAQDRSGATIVSTTVTHNSYRLTIKDTRNLARVVAIQDDGTAKVPVGA